MRTLCCVKVRVFYSAFAIFFNKIADDIFSCDDSDKNTTIIDHRNKVLIHNPLQKIFHGCVNIHRRIEIFSDKTRNICVFCCADVSVNRIVFTISIQNIPQEIAFCHCSLIDAVVIIDRNGGIVVIVHFFQALPNGIVAV